MITTSLHRQWFISQRRLTEGKMKIQKTWELRYIDNGEDKQRIRNFIRGVVLLDGAQGVHPFLYTASCESLIEFSKLREVYVMSGKASQRKRDWFMGLLLGQLGKPDTPEKEFYIGNALLFGRSITGIYVHRINGVLMARFRSQRKWCDKHKRRHDIWFSDGPTGRRRTKLTMFF